MPVTITGGRIPPRERVFNPRLHSEEDTAQSLTSAPQAVLLTTDLTTFGGGTASGPLADLYTLADGTEGQEKELLMLATGEAKIDLSGTATRITLEALDDYVYLRFKHSLWRRLSFEAVAAVSGDPHYTSHDPTHVATLPTAASHAGANTLAMGDSANSRGHQDITIGDSAETSANSANVETSSWNRNIAIGYQANADGSVGGSVAIGEQAKALWSADVAIGDGAVTAASEGSAIAIGLDAETFGSAAIAIGPLTQAVGDDSIAIGNFAVAADRFCIAIGQSANISGATGAIAIGNTANAVNNDAIAIGQFAEAQGINSIALGRSADETRDECTHISQTGAFRVSLGTTAQRPGTGVKGDVRYNSSLNKLEYYDGSKWNQVLATTT